MNNERPDSPSGRFLFSVSQEKRDLSELFP